MDDELQEQIKQKEGELKKLNEQYSNLREQHNELKSDGDVLKSQMQADINKLTDEKHELAKRLGEERAKNQDLKVKLGTWKSNIRQAIELLKKIDDG